MRSRILVAAVLILVLSSPTLAVIRSALVMDERDDGIYTLELALEGEGEPFVLNAKTRIGAVADVFDSEAKEEFHLFSLSAMPKDGTVEVLSEGENLTGLILHGGELEFRIWMTSELVLSTQQDILLDLTPDGALASSHAEALHFPLLRMVIKRPLLNYPVMGFPGGLYDISFLEAERRRQLTLTASEVDEFTATEETIAIPSLIGGELTVKTLDNPIVTGLDLEGTERVKDFAFGPEGIIGEVACDGGFPCAAVTVAIEGERYALPFVPRGGAISQGPISANRISELRKTVLDQIDEPMLFPVLLAFTLKEKEQGNALLTEDGLRIFHRQELWSRLELWGETGYSGTLSYEELLLETQDALNRELLAITPEETVDSYLSRCGYFLTKKEGSRCFAETYELIAKNGWREQLLLHTQIYVYLLSILKEEASSFDEMKKNEFVLPASMEQYAESLRTYAAAEEDRRLADVPDFIRRQHALFYLAIGRTDKARILAEDDLELVELIDTTVVLEISSRMQEYGLMDEEARWETHIPSGEEILRRLNWEWGYLKLLGAEEGMGWKMLKVKALDDALTPFVLLDWVTRRTSLYQYIKEEAYDYARERATRQGERDVILMRALREYLLERVNQGAAIEEAIATLRTLAPEEGELEAFWAEQARRQAEAAGADWNARRASAIEVYPGQSYSSPESTHLLIRLEGGHVDAQAVRGIALLELGPLGGQVTISEQSYAEKWDRPHGAAGGISMIDADPSYMAGRNYVEDTIYKNIEELSGLKYESAVVTGGKVQRKTERPQPDLPLAVHDFQGRIISASPESDPALREFLSTTAIEELEQDPVIAAFLAARKSATREETLSGEYVVSTLTDAAETYREQQEGRASTATEQLLRLIEERYGETENEEYRDLYADVYGSGYWDLSDCHWEHINFFLQDTAESFTSPVTIAMFATAGTAGARVFSQLPKGYGMTVRTIVTPDQVIRQALMRAASGTGSTAARAAAGTASKVFFNHFTMASLEMIGTEELFYYLSQQQGGAAVSAQPFLMLLLTARGGIAGADHLVLPEARMTGHSLVTASREPILILGTKAPEAGARGPRAMVDVTNVPGAKTWRIGLDELEGIHSREFTNGRAMADGDAAMVEMPNGKALFVPEERLPGLLRGWKEEGLLLSPSETLFEAPETIAALAKRVSTERYVSGLVEERITEGSMEGHTDGLSRVREGVRRLDSEDHLLADRLSAERLKGMRRISWGNDDRLAVAIPEGQRERVGRLVEEGALPGRLVEEEGVLFIEWEAGETVPARVFVADQLERLEMNADSPEWLLYSSEDQRFKTHATAEDAIQLQPTQFYIGMSDSEAARLINNRQALLPREYGIAELQVEIPVEALFDPVGSQELRGLLLGSEGDEVRGILNGDAERIERVVTFDEEGTASTVDTLEAIETVETDRVVSENKARRVQYDRLKAMKDATSGKAGTNSYMLSQDHYFLHPDNPLLAIGKGNVVVRSVEVRRTVRGSASGERLTSRQVIHREMRMSNLLRRSGDEVRFTYHTATRESGSLQPRQYDVIFPKELLAELDSMMRKHGQAKNYLEMVFGIEAEIKMRDGHYQIEATGIRLPETVFTMRDIETIESYRTDPQMAFTSQRELMRSVEMHSFLSGDGIETPLVVQSNRWTDYIPAELISSESLLTAIAEMKKVLSNPEFYKTKLVTIMTSQYPQLIKELGGSNPARSFSELSQAGKMEFKEYLRFADKDLSKQVYQIGPGSRSLTEVEFRQVTALLSEISEGTASPASIADYVGKRYEEAFGEEQAITQVGNEDYFQYADRSLDLFQLIQYTDWDVISGNTMAKLERFTTRLSDERGKVFLNGHSHPKGGSMKPSTADLTTVHHRTGGGIESELPQVILNFDSESGEVGISLWSASEGNVKTIIGGIEAVRELQFYDPDLSFGMALVETGRTSGESMLPWQSTFRQAFIRTEGS